MFLQYIIVFMLDSVTIYTFVWGTSLQFSYGYMTLNMGIITLYPQNI